MLVLATLPAPWRGCPDRTTSRRQTARTQRRCRRADSKPFAAQQRETPATHRHHGWAARAMLTSKPWRREAGDFDPGQPDSSSRATGVTDDGAPGALQAPTQPCRGRILVGPADPLHRPPVSPRHGGRRHAHDGDGASFARTPNGGGGSRLSAPGKQQPPRTSANACPRSTPPHPAGWGRR